MATTPQTTSLIGSSSPPPSLPPHSSPPSHVPISSNPSLHSIRAHLSRRSSSSLLFLLLASAPLSSTPPAFAFSLGISGPKEWLKDQKRKTAKFVLAPIYASRDSLRSAYGILGDLDLNASKDVGGDLRKLLNSAARDCVVEDRSTIVAFQARTGVEVCTFSLLVKNAASLLDDQDPVKLETVAKLEEVIRSFYSLGRLVDNCDFQLLPERQKVQAGLMETISALNSFEQGIKNCLGV